MENGGGYQGYQNRLKRTSSELDVQSTPPSETNNDNISSSNNNNNNGASTCVREQDRFMPIANVIRIMRKVLPAHAKISDDAKETIQECVSEYISFITGEANDRCQSEQRKTVTAEDVLWAMSKLGFDDYVDPLSLYLRRYREVEGDLRGSVRGDPHGLSLLHPPPPPPPPRRAHGPLRSLSGPPAHEFGGYGPVWEHFYGGGGGGGGYVNVPGVGPSHGPGPDGYEAYGPPPPYK